MAELTDTTVEDDDAARGGGDDGPGDDAAGDRPGRRRWLFIGLLVVAVVAVVVAGVFVLSDDGDDDDDEASTPDRELPTPPPSIEGELDDEGEELLDLLETGNELSYHATYEVTGDPDVIGSELRLEVWRDDGRVRQDLHQVTETATVDASSFLLSDDEVVSCQRVDEGDWTCARQATGDEFTAAGMFGNMARELEGADVAVTEEEVAGRAAQCFSTSGPDGEVSQCMSEDGIPLSRTGNGTELVLVDLSEEVPDGTFTPPAEPSGN